MENFCKTSLWDANMTWYTDDPYFTSCFEDTLLIWTPFCLMIAISFLYYIKTSIDPAKNTYKFPHNSTLLSSRWIICMTLCLMSSIGILGIFFHSHEVSYDLLPWILRLISYILMLWVLTLKSNHNNQMADMKLLYWSIVTICDGIIFRTTMKQINNKNLDIFMFLKVAYMPIELCQFLLHCWSANPIHLVSIKNICPKKSSSFFSQRSYFWMEKLFFSNFRNACSNIELWDVYEEYKSKHQINLMKSSETSNFVKTLSRIHKKSILIGGIMRLFQDTLPFLQTQTLGWLVVHVSEGSLEESWKGFLYAGLMLIISLAQTFISIKHMEVMQKVGMKISTATSSIIFQKSLSLSEKSKNLTSIGEITNLMVVHLQKIVDLASLFHMIWTAPLQIFATFYLLYLQFGISSLAGIAAMLLMIIINLILTSFINRLQKEQVYIKDQRLKLINEILEGLKVIRLSCWDSYFFKRVTEIRLKENNIIKSIGNMSGCITAFFTWSTFITTFSIFAAYIFENENNILTSEKVFVGVALINITSTSLNMFPNVISLLIQASIGVQRLNAFLSLEEITARQEIFCKNDNHDNAAVIKNGTFSWNNEKLTLHNINLCIKKRSLSAVVGKVGSGKSSLISLLLRDIYPASGNVDIMETISYSSQATWLQNVSIRENILFHSYYDEGRYNEVIYACGLIQDIQNFEYGDATVIGENGNSLSGGQRQRVSLARTAYNDSNIYIFDDSFNALDAKVLEHVYKYLIGPSGLLRDKTRLIVTPSLPNTIQADSTFVIENGKIIETITNQNSTICLNIPVRIEKNNFISIETKTDIKIDAISYSSLSSGLQSEDSSLDHNKIRLLTSYALKCGMHITMLTIGINLLSTGAATYSSVFLSVMTDVESKKTITKNIIAYGGLGVIQVITLICGAFALARGTVNASKKYHKNMLERIRKATNSFFDSASFGDILNKFSKDMDIVDIAIPLNIRLVINIFLQVVSAFFIVGFAMPVFLAIGIPMLMFYIFLQRYYVVTSCKLKRLESESKSLMISSMRESVLGSSTIRAFQKCPNFMEEFSKIVDRNMQINFYILCASMWMKVRLEIIGSIIIFAVSIFVVVSKNDITPAVAGLSISSALKIMQLLNVFMKMLSDLETNSVALERISQMDCIPQETLIHQNAELPKDWPKDGKIIFNDYKLKYNNDHKYAIKGISCCIGSKEKIAVVGRTGAGKSSLISALFRMEEASEGFIEIDGVNINQIMLSELRLKLTIIPQTPFLFNGTIRENLDPLSIYSDNDIWKYLEVVNLKSQFIKMTEGLSFTVEQRGSNFSAGQRQLLCLVRALLRSTNIVVLDEATANLDDHTEKLLQSAMQTEFKNSTLIAITHRLKDIDQFDRVLVMDDGKIVEFDEPALLLRNEKSYLYKLSAKEEFYS